MTYKDPGLLSKIYGCDVAGAIGNAIGDKVEGDSYQSVEEKYGLLDHFVEGSEKASHTKNDNTYDQYRYAHYRAPASTEDGYERHKLCASAIIRKGGHINVDELTQTFVRQIDSTKFGYLLGWQDQFVYYSARAGMKARELGEFASWPGKIGTTKMIMPIGMINAGDPERAYKEAVNCARIKDAPGNPENHGVEVAGVVAAAVAEALKPEATLDSVIDTALSFCSERLRATCNKMLNKAKSIKNWKDLRPFYTQMFEGKEISMADEILSAGLAVLYLAKGNPKDAIIIASNIGRDTDCKAYVAGGLAGALMGAEAVPSEWIAAVEKDVQENKYTLSRRTSWERAIAFYRIVMKDRYGDEDEKEETIEQILRDKINKGDNYQLTEEDYQKIVSLDAGNCKLTSLNGIEKLTNLEWLKLDKNEITDISCLKGLTKLEHLDLGLNHIKDVSALSSLKNLDILMLYGNEITDISALKDLVKIQYLNLADNHISDISALSDFQSLDALLLENNNVTDITPIANNSGLRSLSLDHNKISNIQSIGRFTKLISLYLSNNRISDASPLNQLTNTLKCLNLNDNLIIDAAPLSGLTRLIHLSLNRNKIRDLSFLNSLICLRYLEIDSVSAGSICTMPTLKHLNAADNCITELGPIEDMKELYYLNLTHNQITDIEPLENLRKLKYLYLAGNPLQGSVAAPGKLPLLEETDIEIKQ